MKYAPFLIVTSNNSVIFQTSLFYAPQSIILAMEIQSIFTLYFVTHGKSHLCGATTHNRGQYIVYKFGIKKIAKKAFLHLKNAAFLAGPCVAALQHKNRCGKANRA